MQALVGRAFGVKMTLLGDLLLILLLIILPILLLLNFPQNCHLTPNAPPKKSEMACRH